jgi:hypothetical protein
VFYVGFPRTPLKFKTNKMQSRKRPSKQPKKSRKVNYHAIPLPIQLAPPPYIAQRVKSDVFRFCTNATSTLAGIFTLANLASMMGLIATAATTSVFLSDMVKIRRICMWSTPATAGVPVTNSIKWIDDPGSTVTAGPPQTNSGTSVSFDRPAYCCLEAPKSNVSVFSQWVDSSLTTQWVVVVAPAGTIMDLHCDYILDDVGTTSAGPALVAATAGTVYHKIVVTGAATWTAVAPLNSI